MNKNDWMATDRHLQKQPPVLYHTTIGVEMMMSCSSTNMASFLIFIFLISYFLSQALLNPDLMRLA